MIPREKEKIIFLNPPLTTAQRYGVLSQAGSVEPPIGLAYLAAAVRAAGFKTSILDALALQLTLEQTLEIILKNPPEFLAISLTTMALQNSIKLASLVKKSIPETKVIIGGCHLTALPEETMLNNRCFDLGVIGEGEKTIVELLKMPMGKDLRLVKGIVFRENGKVVFTGQRERIDNLDELPFPAFDLLPKLSNYYRPSTQSIKYLPSASLVTSRGCSGSCLFCDRKTFGNKIKMHSAEYIADLMEKLSKDFGIKGVIFEDDNFMLS
ncbi:MAG: cobalamin-dependent protein, partial [Candidatus Omnitrophica bacterium]|nr:cobalamin-dependent protein [Candidatus Omnitrophota bacterium]